MNAAVGYFSFARKLPGAGGEFIETRELIRLWGGPRPVFCVVRRPRGHSVVVALPPANVPEFGHYRSCWLIARSRASRPIRRHPQAAGLDR